ncbi:transmembrane protein [Cystoisospora suis]|uniref:Transmembrane protein n=1 Tax=Cystoisospora suis TaxID=483139 RepID=A0A2C6L621_9APIC|nr:transmembrane protein [Cystoisospora suis]
MTCAIRFLLSFLPFLFSNGISSLLQTNLPISRLAVSATGVNLRMRAVRHYNLGNSPCRTTAFLSGANFSRDRHSHPRSTLCHGDIPALSEHYLDVLPQTPRQNDKTAYQKEDIEGRSGYSSSTREVPQCFQLSSFDSSEPPRSSRFRSVISWNSRRSSSPVNAENLFPTRRWTILFLHTHCVDAPPLMNARVSLGSGLQYMQGGRPHHGETSCRPISSSDSHPIELSVPSKDRSPSGGWSWSTTSKYYGHSFSSLLSLGYRSISATGNLRRKDEVPRALLSPHRSSFSNSPVPTLFLTPLLSSQSAHFAFRTEAVALPAALFDQGRSGACCFPTAPHTTAVTGVTSVFGSGQKSSLTPRLSSLFTGCSFSFGTSRLFASRPKPKEEKRARNFQRAYIERQKRAAREEKRLMQMQRQLLAQQQEQNEKIKEEQRLRRERAVNTGEEASSADGSSKGDGAGTLSSAATVGSRTLTQLMQQSLLLSGEPVKHRENWVIVGSTQRRARRRDQQKFSQQRAFVQSVFTHLSEEQREEEVLKAERSWRGDMMLDELEEELGGPDALAPGGGGV